MYCRSFWFPSVAVTIIVFEDYSVLRMVTHKMWWVISVARVARSKANRPLYACLQLVHATRRCQNFSAAVRSLCAQAFIFSLVSLVLKILILNYIRIYLLGLLEVVSKQLSLLNGRVGAPNVGKFYLIISFYRECRWIADVLPLCTWLFCLAGPVLSGAISSPAINYQSGAINCRAPSSLIVRSRTRRLYLKLDHTYGRCNAINATFWLL